MSFNSFVTDQSADLGLVTGVSKTTYSELLFEIKLFSIQVWQAISSSLLISFSCVILGELGCSTIQKPIKVRK